MKAKFSLAKTIAILMMCCSFVFTSCESLAGPSSMQVWLDQPLEGSSFEPGENITIMAHARDANGPGISEIQFFANGENIGVANTDASSPLVAGSLQWQPEPGEYVVMAKAINGSGQMVSSGGVHIEVTGVRENGPSPMTNSITPTFTPTGTKKPFTPTFTPTGTKKPFTPTFTFTPKPPGSISIWSDETSIFSGSCTSLRWSSTNVTDLQINGGGVNANGDMSVCPTSSTTYTIRGQSSTGAIEKSTFIEVLSVPPPTPPCPSGRTSSIAYINLPGGNCSTHPLGESFTLCFGLSLSGVESEFNYAFEDYTNASVSGDGNPSGTKSVLWTGTLSSVSNQVCKNVKISGSTGLEAVKLVIWSSSYSTSDADSPIVWLKVVP